MSSSANVTRLAVVERAALATLTSLTGFVFFCVNVTLMVTLRGRAVFRDTSRYVLLFNLLFADTLQMSLSQLLYLLSVFRVLLTFPVCGFMVMLSNATSEISPLTLVVMSLERYVAVCHPLRYGVIVNNKNTTAAVLAVWAASCVNTLARVFLFLEIPLALDSLQMNDFCSSTVMFHSPSMLEYNKAYTAFLFLSSTVTIVASYVGVIIAARSASVDDSSASKARNTLLLHLFQLGLSLMSTMANALLAAMYRVLPRRALLLAMNFMYIFVFLLPRCLSAFIYGVRDRTIRTALFYNVCCGRNCGRNFKKKTTTGLTLRTGAL